MERVVLGRASVPDGRPATSVAQAPRRCLEPLTIPSFVAWWCSGGVPAGGGDRGARRRRKRDPSPQGSARRRPGASAGWSESGQRVSTRPCMRRTRRNERATRRGGGCAQVGAKAVEEGRGTRDLTLWVDHAPSAGGGPSFFFLFFYWERQELAQLGHTWLSSASAVGWRKTRFSK